ncbi:hypothetical protein [Brevundimonas sp.]|uniref:hypothetical protein n=1 Tax=Brevundimonas sp. TaxID=1871086 RepID=UPI0024892B96|nr:hypothetical protein [Brevundimonas sp.]MDI1279997.1 hypothetical protein [Brevundimonas sp.]
MVIATPGDARYGPKQEPQLSRLFHTLCVSFCAALLAVASLYGASQTGHRIAHASDWPPIASPGSAFDADHDPLHVHVAPGPATGTDATGGEDPDTGETRPTGHHHAATGDSPNAVPETGHGVKAILRSTTGQRWSAGDLSRPNHDEDGPEYPPKRMRTVI